jgi:undecaprenyl-phosphate 4-deoxy-4-formamido-L-arabinose transferase
MRNNRETTDLRYSVIIPIYNEADNINFLYTRVSVVMDSLEGDYELILINDGSNDNSESLLKDIAKKDNHIVFINFKRNFGQHPAVVAGLLKAAGNCVITLDADLQNPPEEIPRLISELDKGFDEVSGKRKRRKDSMLRIVPSFFVNLIISLKTGVWLEDYGSMLRVFNRETAKKLAEEFQKNRAYITMLIPKVSKNIREIEVLHDERFSGESKYSISKLLEAFFRIFFTRTAKTDSFHQQIFEIDYIMENASMDRDAWL